MGPSYQLTAADQGRRISVRVTGSKPGLSSVSRTSASTAAVAAAPAVAAGNPTIGGSAVLGATLTVNEGVWGPAPVALTYQWLRNGAAIAGATGQSYTAIVADVGAAISVQVTGTKAGYGSATVVSGAVTVAPGTLSGTVAPVISGTTALGSTLTASAGSWSPVPDSVTYQWLRDGSAIAGATAASYTLSFSDYAGAISVRVTGSKAGYTSASMDSLAVAPGGVTGTKYTKPQTPTISGKAKVGSKLTAKVKAWQPKVSAYAYQWLRNGKPIAGATKSTYVVQAEDAGASLKVRVAGLKVGYQPVMKDSKATKKVPKGSLKPGKVSISGKAKVGTTLTAKAGSWKPSGVTLGYQWLRNGKAIGGATGASYVLTSADLGKSISVKVSGSKIGFKNATKTSKKTAKVKA